MTVAADVLPPLLGFAVHTQWVVVDAGANPAGLVASNAQTFVLQ